MSWLHKVKNAIAMASCDKSDDSTQRRAGLGESRTFSRSRGIRCMQEICVSDLSDVHALAALLSGALMGTKVDLGQRVVKATPHTAPSRPIVSTSSWAAVEMWPTMSSVSPGHVSSGLFSLTAAPAAGMYVSVVAGGGTEVADGTLMVGSHNCLVFDSSCTGIHFGNITFEGMLQQRIFAKDFAFAWRKIQ